MTAGSTATTLGPNGRMRLDVAQLQPGGRLRVAGTPVGVDAQVLAELARGASAPVVAIVRDDMRMAQLADVLAFFAADVARIELPAWDCLPYDRASPSADVVSRRIAALLRLKKLAAGAARGGGNGHREAGKPAVLLTTVAAAMQRVVPARLLAARGRVVRKGDRLDPVALARTLTDLGYARVETVADRGDYAVRGGIVDLFPPASAAPLRIDFFGDDVDGIRAFDLASQRTTGQLERCVVLPINEVLLDEEAIRRFRSSYRAMAGAAAATDPLYAAVSAGNRHQGFEHWLPLFCERMETVFDAAAGAVVVLDQDVERARDERSTLIAEYFAARTDRALGRFSEQAAPYYALPPDRLYLTEREWRRLLAAHPVVELSAFAAGEAEEGDQQANCTIDAGGRIGLDFTAARLQPDVNVYDAVNERIAAHQREGRRVVLAAVSRGSRDRLTAVLREHDIARLTLVDGWAEVAGLDRRAVAVAVLGLERGFVTADVAVIAEPDILGERMVRRAARRIRPENFLKEAQALQPGDLVVHIDHGIGRYDGLEAVSVDGAPHDCLRVLYADNDRLFLPVENIEMVSRFGAESEGIALDKLGGAGWQARKARMKQRLREMADELIRLAAARAVVEAPAILPPPGAFDEFCARFPWTETDDQARAIGEVLEDLASGRPADRLICGDVGFGKTEVALRAAFATAIDGRQVAVIVPTTLLCRQHIRTFSERFRGFPIRVAEISRLASAKDAKAAKAGLKEGTVDIIVGTHALLAKDITFRDLGLVIVDEEQHFGVAHKERLKRLRADVHVLTLTATPIPRTLQMALSGVREMSLIATPPVDRLAVRTYVLEFDPPVIREAILREKARGGQSFYVCPHIEDLDQRRDLLAALVPEVSVVMAHGRLAARELEDAVGAFYEGRFDVLLSTNIIESGLDLPSVNTIIIHRADMFGLAQLYQLRGRVGRGKLRAYAYLTLPPKKKLTRTAEKRLSVMQALDALGAGFTLASHDLDIRGAGNLLGDEQSGHIREVGIELYQQMLEDAVAAARSQGGAAEHVAEWSPQISLGLSVLIPESYVPDLGVRLGLYRRLGELQGREPVDAFAAELIDRFGALPTEVNNLLEVVQIKQFCKLAGIERIEAGPKGAVLTFRRNIFADPIGLVQFIGRNPIAFKLRPDQRLVLRRALDDDAVRLAAVRDLVRTLARIAAGAGAA